jgi:hypothetical protein
MTENTQKYSFENWIIQCCKAKEWDLRKFLKRVLSSNGFDIKEDDYRTRRGSKYANVHNMLATRGNRPRVCLVAHTDVCRDHVDDTQSVDPVIKYEPIGDETMAIIQDRNCDVQVGGDDRLGIAINTWIALNTGYDVSLLFTTDEEIGLISAEYVKFPDLLDFDILLQVDRGNHTNQLVNNIGGVELCSQKTANRLIKISEDIGIPRRLVNGLMTDVLSIKTNHMCRDAVNMTCGYHNSYGENSSEYIDIQEAKDTMKYVASIVKYYDLEEDKNEPEQEEIDFDIDEDVIPLHIRAANSNNDNRQGRSAHRRNGRRIYQENYEELWSEQNYNRDKNDEYFDEQEYRSGWNRFI